MDLTLYIETSKIGIGQKRVRKEENTKMENERTNKKSYEMQSTKTLGLPPTPMRKLWDVED